MSMSSIKDWFANVDISHTDWRVRWPLIILPFLLFALLILLFRANQFSTAQTDATEKLQKLVQSGDSAVTEATATEGAVIQDDITGAAATDSSVSQAPTGNTEKDMAALQKDAQQLLEWFEKGRSTPIPAEQAATKLSSLSSVQINKESEPDKTFWEEFSKQLAVLQITRLHNRSLIIAALSAFLFGLLLWGLWRGARQRHKALEGKHRSEQDAIVQLLDEITPLAQGDLRVRATVGEASTGAVADAFNFAVDELRRLVRAVTESADLVNSSVNETRDSAYHLARASSVQAREVHRSSNHLNVMSDTMAQLSAHAVESSRIAEQSVEHARAGNQAVQSSADGLLRIRDQAEMTSRLMQRLVETSGAINERVRDIQDVAKRTDLLALNATIRSSAQISNGGSEDVSMLSDDIAHLSETLGRATREITNLSDIVQQDAIITLKSMAKTVYELDGGQRTAVQASDALTEIDRVSIKLNGLIADIASKSLRQAGVVKQLSSNMAVINNITSDSARQLQESAKALEQCQRLQIAV